VLSYRPALIYGNPRCTGFSCVTAGYSEHGHGPRARQCQDINDLMSYSLGHADVVCWESVQQAYTVGKPLLDEWTEVAKGLGYRVAHVFVNAMTFGNCQNRRRYFYVAYPADKQFNVTVPDVSPFYNTLYDVIWKDRNRETYPVHKKDFKLGNCDRDGYLDLGEEHRHYMDKLPTGWCANTMGAFASNELPDSMRDIWRFRTSDMPFSMHSPFRTAWMRPCPTLKSTSSTLIHPWHHRPLTVGELSDIMGWDGIVPVGPVPIYQIAKGIAPIVGEWIANQVDACLSDQWNGEEWSTRFNMYTGQFEGEDSTGQLEKVIDITEYYGHQFDIERYPVEAREQFHGYRVDPETGKLIKSWKKRHATVY